MEQVCIDDRLTLVLDPLSGAFRGAHRDRVFEIRDGVEIVGVKQKTGEPLNAEMLAAVLPDRNALLAQVVALQADLATRTSERDALAADKANLQAQVAALEAQQGGSAGGAPVLTAVQVRLGLLAGGITPEAVDAAIDGIADATQRATARTYWEYATQYHRDHPMIGTFAALLGLSEAQVDAMWEAAAAIV